MTGRDAGHTDPGRGRAIFIFRCGALGHVSFYVNTRFEVFSLLVVPLWGMIVGMTRLKVNWVQIRVRCADQQEPHRSRFIVVTGRGEE